MRIPARGAAASYRIAVIDRPTELGDAADVRRIVTTYADHVYDLVRRTGCSPDRAIEVLLVAIGDMLDGLAADPGGVEDLLGGWLRAAQTMAVSAATGSEPTAECPDPDDVGVRVEAALDDLEPDSARLLLLRDSYDLPPGAVAVAIGVDVPELRRRIATARLSFLRRYDPAATQLLLELPSCAADPGELAALCDSTAPPSVDANLRRHAYRCQRCEETAEVQRRARRILSWVAPQPMDPPALAALAAAAARLASGQVITLEALLDAGSDLRRRPIRRRARRRRPAPALVATALSVALVAGVSVGLTDLGAPSGPRPGSSQPQGGAGAPPAPAAPTARPR